MTRFRNVKLGIFRQYQNTKHILKKKNMGQNRFKKRLRFQKFQLSNFTYSNLTYSKELHQKIKTLDKLILKSICIKQISEILCQGYIEEQQQSFSEEHLEESVPERNYKNMGIIYCFFIICLLYIQFNRNRFIKFFLYNILLDPIQINLLMKREIHAATVRTAFF